MRQKRLRVVGEDAAGDVDEAPANPSSTRLKTIVKRVIRRHTSLGQFSTGEVLLNVFGRHASAEHLMSEADFIRACDTELTLNMTAAELSRVFAWATSGMRALKAEARGLPSPFPRAHRCAVSRSHAC